MAHSDKGIVTQVLNFSSRPVEPSLIEVVKSLVKSKCAPCGAEQLKEKSHLLTKQRDVDQDYSFLYAEMPFEVVFILCLF